MELRMYCLPDFANVCTDHYLIHGLFDLPYASAGTTYAQLCSFIWAYFRYAVCTYVDKSFELVPPFRGQRGAKGAKRYYLTLKTSAQINT
jgi:hypothetical protein